MKVYFISGLGADEKMFQRILLPDTYEIVHLKWIAPFKAETFEHYAQRLAKNIKQEEPFMLLGLSLGGMIAVEMNKFLQPQYTILISSAIDKSALPIWFKIAGWLHIPFVTPNWFYRHRSFISDWLLGVQSKEDKVLLASTMQQASPHFVRWAVPRIVRWSNCFVPAHYIHLHGTKDVILPYQKAAGTIPIQEGTHFMVYNKANEINTILAEKLSAFKN